MPQKSKKLLESRPKTPLLILHSPILSSEQLDDLSDQYCTFQRLNETSRERYRTLIPAIRENHTFDCTGFKRPRISLFDLIYSPLHAPAIIESEKKSRKDGSDVKLCDKLSHLVVMI